MSKLSRPLPYNCIIIGLSFKDFESKSIPESGIQTVLKLNKSDGGGGGGGGGGGDGHHVR